MKRLIVIAVLATVCASAAAQKTVSGTVSCDGVPISGVKVSDGKTIVLTDSEGRYELVCEDKAENVFITSPSGYAPLSEDGIRPDFFSRLGKEKSQVHDFRLRKEAQDNYSVIFMTDLHLTGADFKPDQEVFLEQVMPNVRRQAEAASEHGPVYAFNLGDFSHERYWYQCDYDLEDAFNTLVEAEFPVLMYSVPGNHDNDSAVRTEDTDWDAGWLYRKVLGPEYYSVDIGDGHWLFMDDIIYVNGPFKPSRPRAVGAAGSLSYERGFTPTQMEWLAQDLSYLPDSSRIFICTHSPIISDSKKGYTFPKEQMDSLSSLFARFSNVTVFAGHMHRMYFKRSDDYPIFETSVLTATSGDMWESEPNRLLGIEGEDGGLMVANFLESSDRFAYHTHLYGEKCMRVFDLNTVGRYYRRDKDIRRQMEHYTKRTDYADDGFRNTILVNYWMYKEGQKVEILEEGRLLDTHKVEWEDPLFNASYYLHAFLGKHPVAPGQTKVGNHHAFAAVAAKKNSDVVVRVLDTDGNVIHEEHVRRPKRFKLKMR